MDGANAIWGTRSSVFLLEDDAPLRTTLARSLHEEGYATEEFACGAELLSRLERTLPDVLVIDIGLPDGDGREICRTLRARGVVAPVLFLTARYAHDDELSGFAAGGDDYVTKPFSLDLLLARLEVLARRGHELVPRPGLHLEPESYCVVSEGQRVELSPTEFEILARLAGSLNKAVSRADLMRAAWPAGAIVHANTLEVYVSHLRHKLAALPGEHAIATVHGVGYRLE